MKILEAFIAMDRRQALAKGEDIPRRMTGTLLFADIAGFTSLMGAYIEDLGRHRGTEELSQQLSLFFATLIKHLYRYKGSVISFSGDAITCWFRDDDGLRALTASERIQQAIRPFSDLTTSANSKASIELKISIVHGVISRFVIGDPAITRFDVITGKAVDRVAMAERLARKGEILIDDRIYRKHRAFIDIGRWGTAESGEQFGVVRAFNGQVAEDPWGEPASLALGELRTWVLPSVFEKLTQGQERFITELRLGVVCFIKFSMQGLDDTDTGLGRLDRFVRYVQQQAVRHEGNVLQITFGDKGNILFLGFGSPVSHEDDIDRALKTLQTVHHLPRDLDYITSVQAGVSRGYLRTGYYGGRDRCTYTFLGEHTNLAARLMNKALPGQILASQSIQQGARQFEFTPLDAIPLKGFLKPMPVFVVSGRKVGQKYKAGANKVSTIDRDREKTELRQRLLALKPQNRSQCFLLESDTGLGKSNLVQWLIGQARKARLKIFVGQAEAIERQVPYHALAPVLYAIFDLDVVNESEPVLKARVNAFLRELDPQLPSWAPLLNAILSIRWEETERTGALNGEERGQKLRWLLKKVLVHWAENQPVLLVVENAQWIDASTWTFIEEMLQTVPSFFVILPARSGKFLPEQYLKLKSAQLVGTLIMEPLSKKAIREVLGSHFSFAHLDPFVLDFLYQKTAGNPLFSIEFVNYLLEQGALKIEGDRCEPYDPGIDFNKLSLPDSIHGVILNRVDQLTTRQQLVLKVASVLGPSFAFHYLQILYPVKEDLPLLNQLLAELTRSSLLKEEPSEEGVRFQFEHEIVQAVVYDLIPFKLRRSLHLELIRWLEREYSDNLNTFHAVLGYHAEAAEEWQKAAGYRGKIGEKALFNGAYPEAEKNLTHAVQLLRKAPEDQGSLRQMLQLKLMLGAVWIATRGQSSDEVRQCYLEAWEISQKIHEDIPEIATVLFGFSVSYFVQGLLDKAIKMATNALTIAQRINDRQLRIQAHLMLANSHFWAADFAASEVHFQQLTALYDSVEHNQHITRYAQNPWITSLTCNTWLRCMTGHVDQAVLQCEKALQMAEGSGHPFSKAIAYQIKAWLYQHLQQPDIAGPMAETLIDFARREGFPIYENIGRAIRGWARAKMGETEAGIEEIRTVIQNWKTMKARLGLSFFYMQLAEACADAKKWALGLEVIQEAEEALQISQEQPYRAALLLQKGYFHAQLGKQEEAASCLRESLQIAREQKNYLFALRAVLYLSSLMEGREQAEQARALLEAVYDPQKASPDQKEATVRIGQLKNISST